MELTYKSQSSFAESKLLEKVLQSTCLLRFSLMLGHSCWTVETLSALQRLDQLGKTLAFGIPALVHVLCKKKLGDSGRACPWCSVLSPTRELAQQIADVLCEAGKSCGVKSICLFGGSSKGTHIQGLKSMSQDTLGFAKDTRALRDGVTGSVLGSLRGSSSHLSWHWPKRTTETRRSAAIEERCHVQYIMMVSLGMIPCSPTSANSLAISQCITQYLEAIISTKLDSLLRLCISWN
ncbi:hypothetical protein Sjap_022106 [Stephania japonica]|uniref:DEAD/DEAH-box helicase domain-containing protein n=1 Tax=Stephania japonica TaxID=461633 RepID=A0AAP0EX12_9MAGN